MHLKLNSRIYQANTNYFIYARDNAGNWSKFLLDTKGPTSTYTNITSKKVSDGTYSYTFKELKFADPIQTATYGTSDITDVSYKANATQYIQKSKKLDTVRYNKTGKNPWESGASYSTASLNTSTGACTLSNVSVSVTEKLYVFVKDGYGNISKFTYVPIVFDAQSGGATSTGKFSDGSTTSSTLGLVGSTLNIAQEPSSPLLGNQRFRYWYNSKDSGKYQVSLTRETVSDETTYYYPQWTYPTLTSPQRPDPLPAAGTGGHPPGPADRGQVPDGAGNRLLHRPAAPEIEKEVEGYAFRFFIIIVYYWTVTGFRYTLRKSNQPRGSRKPPW